MAGTIHGLGFSQWRNQDGTPMEGAKLYIYEATTSTPADAFKDFGLTPSEIHPHPILTDANGLLPSFWTDDGSFRVRMTNAAGSLILFDQDSIQAIGPSSGEGGGGGGVSATAILQTGDFIWSPKSGTRNGFVRANGRTLGSATSGAAERANADVEPLFLELWNNYSDTLCAVGGGRGANAAADWAANKTITTLNMRGMTAAGLADMGNADSGILDNVTFTVGNKTTAASLCGAALHTLTEAELAAHDHGVTDPGHTHTLANADQLRSQSSAVQGFAGGGFATGVVIVTANSATTGVTVDNAGSGTAHNNMPPTRVGNWLIKL